LKYAIQIIASFVRNVQLKRVLHDVEPDPHLNFWRVIYGNFHDVAVIEWCKLFGSDHAEHQPVHWKSLVPEIQQDEFRDGLLDALSITQEKWVNYWQHMKEHRDNHVAHFNEEYLRPENDPNFPEFDLALKAAYIYYGWILRNMLDSGQRNTYPEDIGDYCLRFSEQATEAAIKAINATAQMGEGVN